MTDAQKRAIAFLGERDGSGVIDRYGRVVAHGEVCKQDPATWLRLVAHGFVVGSGGRLDLTPDGGAVWKSMQ